MNSNAIAIESLEHVQDPVAVNFVKVKRIKKISPQPVYNMEVEKVQNFSINSGLIVHNCWDAIRYALTKHISALRRGRLKINKYALR
ncbi:MAG: hypothetical protein EKK64_10950 [Neisseriaceae bacterium]|nr:MAG: hypothetical protein EKK64_10950 [Neisseriaceae bacterium]